MTDTVAALVRAAVAAPDDHTPLLALADALDETHPAGQDGRATLLRKWVAEPKWEPPPGERYVHPHARTMTHHADHETGKASLVHGLVNPPFTQPMYFKMLLGDYGASFNYEDKHRTRMLYIPTAPTQAREIADGLPDSEHVHNFLDDYYGSNEPFHDPYAEHYSRILNAQR